MDNNSENQDYLPEDGESLRGLAGISESSKNKKYKPWLQDAYSYSSQNLNSPWTQKLSNVVGETDYGNSTYDDEITSMSQFNDIEDTRANIQPFIDKLGAGIGTFAGKTLTATAGGLGTLFYGVPNAIAEGRFSAIFDNDFNKALEKANEGIDDTFKVYASEAERNGSFWDQSLGSAHWWTKSLLGDGMSFTAGAILSAYAMGGIGSAIGAGSKAIGLTGALQKGAVATGSFIDDAGMAVRSLANKSLFGGNLPEFTLNQMHSAGRISKAANALKGASQAFNGSEKMLAIGNAAAWDKLVGGAKQFGGLATRFAVGSMYEGGVEANDFIKQSLDRYKQQYAELNGVEPTDEQLDEYKLKILPTANTLFAANVALVGASNLAVLPGIFGKGVNETIKSARKNIVMQTIDDVIKPVLKDETLTGFQKATKLAWRAAKPLASEGLMEEGGQNFAKNMALDYVDKHYNPDSAKNTYNMMNSLGNAFNQAYGTIDGWKEIMAGMVIGGFGSPNIKKIGRFEKAEDGKTKWNPLSLDADKSWWTGGIIGEFQTHRENNKRAQELIDNYNTQDKESAMEYFKQNRSVNQGIAGQISDINHQNTLGGVLDEAAAQGDFFTAKNAEQDKFHSYIKSRVDAGYYETLESELIDPIKEMSDEEFGKAFGYKNMSKQDLAERKSKTINEAKQSIKDTVDAINFVDSRMSFNLGTEEGRMRRDLNVYSIATSKSVGKRIDQLNEVINNAISDRLVNKTDDMTFETPKTVLEAYKFANNIVEAYETKDVSPEELELKEQLESALQDLPKLLRRKEEALELYAVAKDPKAFNNFWKTERVAELIKKRMDEAAEKIAEVQNEEHAEAEKLIDEDVDPETAAKQTGAEKATTAKYKYIKDQKILRAVQVRETAALEHINRIESLINEMKNVEFDSEYSVIVDGVRYSMNYKNGNLESISDINNPRVKIRNPKILNRIKAKILNDSLKSTNVSDSEYEQIKDENPDLKLIEEIYNRLITDKIAQSMYNLYEKKDLRQKDIDNLFQWIMRCRGDISTLLNKSESNEIIQNALDNIDLIELMLIDKQKQLNEKETNKKSSTTKLTKGQIIESQKDEEYWRQQQLEYDRIQQFQSIDEVEAFIEEVHNDPQSTPEDIAEAEEYEDILEESINEASQDIESIKNKSNDIIPSKNGLIDDENNELQPSDESDISTNTNNVDEINKDLRKNDGITETDSDSEKLIDAFNHIAWNNVLYDQSTGQFTYSGIDLKASKLLQDFRKLSVGQKVEFKVNPTAEFPAEDIEHIKIDILINGEVVGYVHTTDYIRPDRVATKDDNLARNKEELIKLREAVLNGLTETTLEKVGNGRLITAREFGGKRTDNIPTNDALPDKNLVITVANNGEIDKKNLPKNSLILNQKGIEQGKGNNFKNGIFALIPVNKVNDNGVEKTSYIAAPLSPQTLKLEQSETITNLVEMFLRNQTGAWINDNQTEFEAISKSIGNQTSYRDELTDQKVEFNPSSLTGLRNVIKLFTYDRVSLKDDLGVDGEAKSTKKIFGINKVKDGSIVVSFGTPKNVTSFKIKQNEAGESQFFIKQAGRSAWEQIESEGFFDSLRAGISDHMNQSFFYHNKSLMRTSNLQIPTVENVDGKLSVKFSTKTYPEFLKDNTQTNLRSVDLGDGNYSYTVQRNIIFATPKVEKIEQPKVENPITELKPNMDIEFKKAEIEKRRREELSKISKITVAKNITIDSARKAYIALESVIGKKEDNESLKIAEDLLNIVGDKGRNDSYALGSLRRLIELSKTNKDAKAILDMLVYDVIETPREYEISRVNTKYDAELAALESQQKPEVKEKPKLQQRRGNGKSIERKKPLSDEDLMPNFSEAVEESTEFKTKPKANTLQMDFITFAKMQEPEIKRSLIAMNRNKEIEVKCK